MVGLFDKIPAELQKDFFKEILKHYVDNQGLGAMPKQDFDALILHLFVKHSKIDYDPFTLSNLFKITESRVKSLRLTGSIKYETSDENAEWMTLIARIEEANLKVRNFERDEVGFKLSDPAQYRFFQNGVRTVKGTCSYSPGSETVTISLRTFFDLMHYVRAKLEEDKPEGHDNTVEKINSIFGSVAKSININSLDDLKKKPKLKEALEYGSGIATIGGAIKTAFQVLQ